ncbi:putative [histone H3]-lysine(4) N-trimethyltransferase chromatin remodeling SET family [Dioscorea sansibarensis]
MESSKEGNFGTKASVPLKYKPRKSSTRGGATSSMPRVRDPNTDSVPASSGQPLSLKLMESSNVLFGQGSTGPSGTMIKRNPYSIEVNNQPVVASAPNSSAAQDGSWLSLKSDQVKEQSPRRHFLYSRVSAVRDVQIVTGKDTTDGSSIPARRQSMDDTTVLIGGLEKGPLTGSCDEIVSSWNEKNGKGTESSLGRQAFCSRVSSVRDFPIECGQVTTDGSIPARKRSAYDAMVLLGGAETGSLAGCCDEVVHSLSDKNGEGVESSTGKKIKSTNIELGVKADEGEERAPLDDEDNKLPREEDESKTIEVTDHASEIEIRKKVKDTLRLFQTIHRKLLQEEESELKQTQGTRVDLKAFGIFKSKGKCLSNGGKFTGSIPGVQVGDEFFWRVEMCTIALHCQHMAGIDYLWRDGKPFAISVVSSGRYPHAEDVGTSEELVYSGCGSPDRDQKLERGNLALRNSKEAQTPVRVIYGFKQYHANDSQEPRMGHKSTVTYIYDGLYLIERDSYEKGKNNRYVFLFYMKRIPGQPELPIKELLRSKRSKLRPGLCVQDVSQGKEKRPINVVNTIDDDKHLMPFEYTQKMIYPSQRRLAAPEGCDCIQGCLFTSNCSCACKNGGEIPFNHNGAIVQAKPLVYECGPSCKCPPSCPNRVSQHGIKFPLEVFKTKSMGWGVRSLKSIPSGSFICEYAGELLEDEEAQKRDSDEYLFAIGNNYHDESVWEGLSMCIPELKKSASFEGVEEKGYTVDASKHGNVGRFINHSCSPNLYAQNVLYDHDDKSMPHIMLFAAENIPPLQELTYHYNYAVDQVHDSDGNIKRKDCHCGSDECTGRLY